MEASEEARSPYGGGGAAMAELFRAAANVVSRSRGQYSACILLPVVSAEERSTRVVVDGRLQHEWRSSWHVPFGRFG